MTEIRKADPPFDDPKADVIIRSTDNIDFHVFKSFLAFSPSVFSDMFCVAQGKPEGGEVKDGLQVIHTDDDSETWNILFRFLYPVWAVGPPVLKSLDEFPKAFESSRKYVMTEAENMIVANLIEPSFLKDDPMRVFALACQFGLEAEARVAAKHTLRIPILGRPFIPEMEYMSARTHHRLQEYHLQCGKVASNVARAPAWVDESLDLFNKKYPNDNSSPSKRRQTMICSNWCREYMDLAAKALEDHPLGVTVLNPDLMDRAITWAGQSLRAITEIREFGEVFAAKVDDATARVVLDIQM